ncbi:MAG TPA: type II toxin-antitoxin system RelB/DinJ family antitoxin [Candidatus Paceibacterota bacterium]
MAKTGYINARVERKLKKDAEAVLERVGVNTSDAVTMFLKQVVLQEGLPFEVRIPNKETRKAIADLEAGRGQVFTGSTKELFDKLAGRKSRKA